MMRKIFFEIFTSSLTNEEKYLYTYIRTYPYTFCETEEAEQTQWLQGAKNNITHTMSTAQTLAACQNRPTTFQETHTYTDFVHPLGWNDTYTTKTYLYMWKDTH